MGTAANGYTCTCGTWVPFGVSHNCTGTSIISHSIDNLILERIAKALERIADVLDR